MPAFAFLMSTAGVVAAQQVPRLPGIGGLGSTFDLLSASRDGIETSIGNLFSMEYDSMTEDGRYMIPHGVLVGEDPECDRDITTQMWEKQEEYDSTRNDGITVGGSFWKFSASYSQQTMHVHNKLKKNTTTIAASRTQCRVYTVTLLPGYAQLNPLFTDALSNLPDTFDNTTAHEFHDFFNIWQTHVLTRCRLGGVMEQLTETNKLYRKTHTEDKYENEVKASFIISIDKTHGSDTQVDKEFEHDTTYEGVDAHGGRMAPDDQWASWAQSVQELESPACLDWTAVEMPDVLLPPWSPKGLVLAAKVPALRAGLAAWFARPGCTDIMASNYNATALTNDTSCVFEPCDEMVQACFDRCEEKYHSKISKDGSDAYECAKGCADMHGGEVRNRYYFCPGVSNTTRTDACMAACEHASGSKGPREKCKYGCGYWSNSTQPNSTQPMIAV